MPPTPDGVPTSFAEQQGCAKSLAACAPTPKRREILQSLNDKKTDAELARGVAETIELLLKKALKIDIDGMYFITYMLE